MGSAFDPVATRARLLDSQHGLELELSNLRQAATEELNLFRWSHALAEIVRARVVGLGDDPRIEAMLHLLLETLGAVDWAEQRRNASTEQPGPGVSRARLQGNLLFNAFQGCTTLALARWLRTGEPQTALFAQAYQLASDYHELTYGKKTKWRIDDVANLVAAGCAAHRFEDVLALFERPPLADYRTLDLARARTTLELGHAIAQHRVHGTLSADDLDALCERTLRREAVSGIELLIRDVAQLAYLVGMVRVEGDPRALLDRITDYVSYLAKAKARANAKPAVVKTPRKPLPAMVPSTPLPTIQLSSSPAGDTSSARVMLASRPTQEWKQVSSGWALRVSDPHDTSALRDPRWPDVIELSCGNHELVTSPALARLVRATPDGKALSALATASTPSPLEVAFPRTVGNWIDGAMVQINPPLTRGVWRQALAVGALRNLRAVSFDARETDKQRIVRGAQPYTVAAPWFWSSPLAQQLEAINVSADLHALRSWRLRFPQLPRLARVYLLVWCKQRELPWARPLRVLIDREDPRLRLTVQCAVSLRVLAPTDLAVLFEGLTRDDVSAIDIETIGGPMTDDVATLAGLLGTDAPIRELRGDGRLAEM